MVKKSEKNIDFAIPLNEKQKRFCEEYLIDLNATQAAIRAGYSDKTANRIASENLSKLDIQEYIAQLQQTRQERLKITQDEVVEKIVEVANRCMQAAPVKFMGKQVKDSQGNNLWKFDSMGATKALDMLMKHLGGYALDNKQSHAQVNVVQKEYILPEEIKQFEEHYKNTVGE